MAVQALVAPNRVADENYTLEAGAKAYFYESGTTTLETVYSDEALTTSHASPLVADAEGTFAQVFHSGTPSLKCVITDSDGNTRYTIDPVLTASSGQAADEVSYSPTADNSADDVQEAIDNNTTLIVANKELSENALKLPQTGGSGNAYTLTSPNTITAYASGQVFQFVVDRANTGAITLNVDSLGAKNVRRYNNAISLADIISDDWRAGEVHRVVYDGTQFVLLSPVGAKTGGVRGIIEKATTAEAEAGTEDNVFPDVVKVKEAIAYQTMVKARGSIDGTAGTPSASDSLNIASVTDNGTGDYTINFTNNMANTNYQCALSVEGTGAAGDRTFFAVAKSVGSVDVHTMDVNGTLADRDFSIIILGTLA